MKRKLIAFILALTLVFSLTSCGNKVQETKEDLSKAILTIYYKSLDNAGTLEVFYKDNNNQIPYVTLDTWCVLANKIYNDGIGDYPKDTGYKVSVSYSEDKATLERENGAHMTLDFTANTVLFDNFDVFIAHSYDVSPQELPHRIGYDKNGNQVYFERVEGKYNYTYGDPLKIDLNSYNIDIIYQDGAYYVPIQTLSDLLLSYQYCNVLYNTKAVFIIDYETTAAEVSSGYTGMVGEYYQDTTSERTQALIDFTYNELCLFLDCNYGLKEAHGIEDFDTYLSRTYCGENKSLKELLTSKNAEEFEMGMSYLVYVAFDDLHSSYMIASSYAGNVGDKINGLTGTGINRAKMFEVIYAMYAAQSAAYPYGIPGYEEIGNTAFIHFDNFLVSDSDFYSEPAYMDTTDTIELMIYAYNMIYREDSPIENVVMDLSSNLGGYEDALCYALGMFLGEYSCTIENPITGAVSTSVYRIDANLDNKFDSKDCFHDKNLYCLTSGMSFSCGNIAPAILRESGKVTMLGSRTGGGSCIVAPFTTASGGWYMTSGCKALMRNHLNSYYGIDCGIEVDYRFDSYDDYYDRWGIVELINGL